MSSARDRIYRELRHVWNWRDMTDKGAVLPTKEQIFDSGTDQVIRIVREALLSDEAIEAADDGGSVGGWEYNYPCNGESAIEAALDAAGFGENGDE